MLAALIQKSTSTLLPSFWNLIQNKLSQSDRSRKNQPIIIQLPKRASGLGLGVLQDLHNRERPLR